MDAAVARWIGGKEGHPTTPPLNRNPIPGIFAVATFFEVIVTVLDYQMKFQLDNAFSNPTDIAHYMASFGQWSPPSLCLSLPSMRIPPPVLP